MDSARDFARVWNIQQGSGYFFVRYGHDRGTLRMNCSVSNSDLLLFRITTGFHWRGPVR